MRNLFLILLLANVVYFGWEYTRTPKTEPGVTLVDPEGAGPRIASLRPGEPGAAPDAGPDDSAGDADATAADADAPPAGADGPGEGDAVDDTGTEPTGGEVTGAADPVVLAAVERTAQPAASAAARGNACISIGPFPDADAAQTALAAAESRGMTASQRALQDDVFAGHWVQVTGIPNREQANALIGKLKEGGLADAYLLRSEPGDNAISLGLFSDINGAQRISQRAEAVGVETVTQETYRERTVHWVDAGGARAADASALAERFGADKVLVGDAARCPGSG